MILFLTEIYVYLATYFSYQKKLPWNLSGNCYSGKRERGEFLFVVLYSLVQLKCFSWEYVLTIQHFKKKREKLIEEKNPSKLW